MRLRLQLRRWRRQVVARSEARFQALQARIRPHFLFNSMNTVASLTRDDILAAHRAAAGRELTDDAAVAELAGLPVALVEGDQENIKVTTQEDLEGAERWLRGGQTTDVRVGQGYDVHAFGPGDHVTPDVPLR